MFMVGPRNRHPAGHKHIKLSPAGFTIIEALIAIVLFAITLSGGMAIYFNANRIVTLSTHKRLAVEIANRTMEEFRADGYAAFDTAYPASVTDQMYPDPVNPLKIGYIPVTRTVTVVNQPDELNPEYKEVGVKISWTEADQVGPRDIVITSIMVP